MYASSLSAPGMAVTSGYLRQPAMFSGRITRDGSSGYLAEPRRYQLYASLADPWSHRALIARRLLGLERVIGLTLTDPIPGERGWRFPGSGGGRDPATGAQWLAELYLATDPGFTGRCTVPLIWDTRQNRIVTNDFSQLTVMMEAEFAGFHQPGAPDLYPAAMRREIDAIGALIHHAVASGVYRTGMATTQADYEDAFDAVFTTLDALEERLGRRRFLLGGQLCEADVRLFPTLARFDAVYNLHFKCNLRRLVDYPHLWAYARDLYQRPGFGDTTDFAQIKRHYYQTQEWINPSRIVPKGPYVSWLEPHGRESLPG
ncbi:MAG: glutathione S-transferase family protein [Streptosporangiaceae bacterium]